MGTSWTLNKKQEIQLFGSGQYQGLDPKRVPEFANSIITDKPSPKAWEELHHLTASSLVSEIEESKVEEGRAADHAPQDGGPKDSKIPTPSEIAKLAPEFTSKAQIVIRKGKPNAPRTKPRAPKKPTLEEELTQETFANVKLTSPGQNDMVDPTIAKSAPARAHVKKREMTFKEKLRARLRQHSDRIKALRPRTPETEKSESAPSGAMSREWTPINRNKPQKFLMVRINQRRYAIPSEMAITVGRLDSTAWLTGQVTTAKGTFKLGNLKDRLFQDGEAGSNFVAIRAKGGQTQAWSVDGIEGLQTIEKDRLKRLQTFGGAPNNPVVLPFFAHYPQPVFFINASELNRLDN